MAQHPFYWVDAFTEEPYRGNPAAVCLTSTGLENVVYQRLAAEINLSETAFAEKIGESEYKLRWFTPVIEMPLCGHATLATAYILFNKHMEKSPISFHTKSGVLKVEKVKEGVRLAFPKFSTSKIEPPTEVLNALGITPPLESLWENSMGAYIFLLKDEEEIQAVKPDFQALFENCKKHNSIGVAITARGSGKYDFVSRVFAPGAGVNEDPVTGLAHCMLAPYWAEKLGKDKMLAFQLSKRGGELLLELEGDLLYITGKAVVLFEGIITF